MDKPPRKKSHPFLILLGAILLVLGVAGIIAAYTCQPYIEKRIARELPGHISRATKGFYDLKFKSVKVHLLAGSIILNGVEFSCTADSLQKAQIDSVPVIVNRATLASVELKGFDYFRLLKKNLHFRKIRLADGSADILIPKYTRKDTSAAINVLDSLKQYLQLISVADIQILNIGVHVTNKVEQPEEIKAHLSGLYLHQFVFDKTTLSDTTLIAFSTSVAADITGINIPNLDGFYKLSLDSVSFSSKDKRIQLYNMAYNSLYSDMVFSRKKGFRTTSMNLQIPYVAIEGLQLIEMLRRSSFITERITVQQMDFSAFTDNSVPLNSKDTSHTTPQDAIRSIPIPLYIGKVEMKDGKTTYGEYGIQSELKGYAHMFKCHGEISNITNIRDSLKKDNKMKASFSSMLEGKVKGGAKMEFDLTSAQSNFTFKAYSAPMPMSLMNEVSYAWSLAKATSGQLNGVVLELKGTASNIKGKLGLNYTGLEVALYKKKKNGDVKLMNFVTNAANDLVIVDDNTTEKSPLRIAQIDYARWNGDAYHNYLMGAVMQGIQLNIGIAKSIQKKVQSGMRNANTKKLEERKKLRVGK